jgi:hypothetical protein
MLKMEPGQLFPKLRNFTVPEEIAVKGKSLEELFLSQY